jgi:hypothetical protein
LANIDFLEDEVAIVKALIACAKGEVAGAEKSSSTITNDASDEVLWDALFQNTSAEVESAEVESAEVESAEVESAEVESAEVESAEVKVFWAAVIKASRLVEAASLRLDKLYLRFGQLDLRLEQLYDQLYDQLYE